MKGFILKNRTKSIAALSAVGVFTLLCAFLCFGGARLFSANAENVVSDSNAAAENDIMVSMIAEATPEFNASAVGDQIPIYVTRYVDGASCPVPDFLNVGGEYFYGAGQGGNFDPKEGNCSNTGKYAAKGEESWATYYQLPINGRIRVNTQHLKVYYLKNGQSPFTRMADVPTDQFISHTLYNDCILFAVPTSDDVEELVFNIPYDCLTGDHNINLEINSNYVGVRLTPTDSPQTDPKKYFFASTNDYDAYENREMRNGDKSSTFKDNKFKVELINIVNEDDFIVDDFQVLTKDDGGSFTVDETATYSTIEGGVRYVTMPDEEIKLKVTVKPSMKKITVNFSDPQHIMTIWQLNIKDRNYCIYDEDNFAVYDRWYRYIYNVINGDDYSCAFYISHNAGESQPLINYGTVMDNNYMEYVNCPYKVSVEVLNDNGEDVTGQYIGGNSVFYSGINGDTPYYLGADSTGVLFSQALQTDVTVNIEVTTVGMPTYKLYTYETSKVARHGLMQAFITASFTAGTATSKATMEIKDLSIGNTGEKVERANLFEGEKVRYSLYRVPLYWDGYNYAMTSKLKSWHIYEVDNDGNIIGDPIEGTNGLPTCPNEPLGCYYRDNHVFIENLNFKMPAMNIAFVLEYDYPQMPLNLEQKVDVEGSIEPTQFYTTVEGYSSLTEDTPTANAFYQYSFNLCSDSLLAIESPLRVDGNDAELRAAVSGESERLIIKPHCPSGYAVTSIQLYVEENYSSHVDMIAQPQWETTANSANGYLTIKDDAEGNKYYEVNISNLKHALIHPVITYGVASNLTVNYDFSGDLVSADTKVAELAIESTGNAQNMFNYTDPKEGGNSTGYSGKLVYDNKGMSGRITLDTSETHPKFTVNMMPSYGLGSFDVKIKNGDGSEQTVGVTLNSINMSSVEVTLNEEIPNGSDIVVDIGYVKIGKIKTKIFVKNSNDSWSMLDDNTTGTVVTVNAGEHSDNETPFAEIDGSAQYSSFNVTGNDEPVYYVNGSTELNILTTLTQADEDAGYVIANIDVSTLNNDGTRGESLPNLTPSNGESVDMFGETVVSHDYSNCHYTLTAGNSIYVSVFIAKTAEVKITVNVRGDTEDDEYVPNTSHDIYVTANYASSAYRGYEAGGVKNFYPLILTYPQGVYNVNSSVVSDEPEKMDVVEQSSLVGVFDLPDGYFVSSVSYVCYDGDGNEVDLGSDPIKVLMLQRDEDDNITQGKIEAQNALTAGYSYEMKINLERVTKVQLEAYHMTDNGGYEPSFDDCYAIGQRPEKSGAANPEFYVSDKPVLWILNYNSPMYNTNRINSKNTYYVLRGTEFTVMAKPAEGDVITKVEVGFEKDSSTFQSFTDRARIDENGYWVYNIDGFSAQMGDTLVIKTYFDSNLYGNITVKMQTVDGSSLDDDAALIVSARNNSYEMPLMYTDSGTYFSEKTLRSTTESSVQTTFSGMTGTAGTIQASCEKSWLVESVRITVQDGENAAVENVYNFTTTVNLSDYIVEGRKSEICFTLVPSANIYVNSYRNYDNYTVPGYYTSKIYLTGENENYDTDPDYPNKVYFESIYRVHTGYTAQQVSLMQGENRAIKDTVPTIHVLGRKGYTLKMVELYKGDELVNTVLGSDMTEGSDGELSYKYTDFKFEQVAGNGYEFKVYYTAVYLKIKQTCLNQYEEPPIRDSCFATCQSDDTNDVVSIDNAVMAFEPGSDPTISITRDGEGHKIKQIRVGLSESTMGDPISVDDHTYSLELADKLGLANLSTQTDPAVTYYLFIENERIDVPQEEVPPPVVTAEEALVRVVVYESDPNIEGGNWRVSTDYKVTLSSSYSQNVDVDPMQVYDSDSTFKPVTGGSNSVVIPYQYSNGQKSADVYVKFPVLSGGIITSLGYTVDVDNMKENFIFRNAVFSSGSGSTRTFTNPSETLSGLGAESYTLELYFSLPKVNIQNNNSITVPKGSVKINDVEKISSNIENMEFTYNRGDNITATIIPEDGYKISSVSVGDRYGYYTKILPTDGRYSLDDESGTVTLALGTCDKDIYMLIFFAEDTQTNFSTLCVSQVVEQSDGTTVPCVDGTVYLTALNGKFNNDGYETGELVLENASSLSTQVSEDTTLMVIAAAPTNYSLKKITVQRYKSGSATPEEINYTTNSFTLDDVIEQNESVYVTVIYNGGYKVTYHGNGNTSGIAPTDNNVYFEGGKATALGGGSLKRTGYEFKGWSYRHGDDNTVDVAEDGDIPITNGDVDLYAVWEPNATYYVTYMGNGNTGGTAPTDINSPYYGGSEVTVLGQGDLLKTNYTFIGWNEDASAAVAQYTKGKTFNINADTTLYAIWLENPKYKVTYKDSMDVFFSHEEQYHENTNFTVKYHYTDFNLEHTGYDFAGWTVAPSGKGYSTDEGKSNTIKEDVEYTAQWTPAGYDVKYYPETGNDPFTTQQHAFKSEVTVGSEVTAPTVIGKSFKEWQLISDNVTITDGKFTMPAETVKFRAVYDMLDYTVTYQFTGSVVPEGLTPPTDTHSPYHYNANVTVLAGPSGYNTDRYVFSGWSSEQVDVTGGSFSMPAENVTIKGSFSENGKVTLTYDPNEGEPDNGVPGSEWAYTRLETNVKNPKTGFGRTGYKFVCWNTKSAGDGQDYFKDDALDLTSDLTLYAKWEKDYFTVEYYPETGDTSLATQTHAFESEVTVGSGVTAPTVTGKSFTGWQLISGNVTITDGKFTMPAATVKFRAVYSYIDYTVTYELEGDVPSEITTPTDENSPYHYGATVTLKPIPSGFYTKMYSFDGWKIDGVKVENSFSMPANNVVVKGYFSVNNEVYLYYDPNGGGPNSALPTAESDFIQLDTKVKAAAEGFGKLGYNFTGWCVSANGVGAKYNVGDDISITSDTTLYAQWSKANFAVEYYEQDGLTFITSNSYEYEDPVTVGSDVTAPDITGKSFKEWQLMSSGAQNDSKGDAISDRRNFPMPAATVKYKAVYSDIDYHVTYVITGSKPTGVNAPVDSTDYHYGDTVSVMPVQGSYDTAQYTFSGWSSEQVDVTGGSFSMPAGDVMITGYFTENGKITLSYHPNEGEPNNGVPGSESKYSAFSTTVKAPDADFHRTGYSFTGWNDPVGIKHYDVNDPITVSVDTTLYAEWSINSYTVKYYDEFGTTTVGSKGYYYKASVTVGDEVTAPTVAGKTFSHWELIDSTQKDADNTAIGNRTGFPMPAYDVSYRAVYTANNYTVRYSVSGNVPSGYTAPTDGGNPHHCGDTINVKPAPTAEGYTFVGWTYNGVDYAEGTANASFTMPAGNVELTGDWTKNPEPAKITVTYIDSDKNVLVKDEVTKDTSYTVRSYTWTVPNGKKFNNWVVVENQVTGLSILDWAIGLFNTAEVNTGDTFDPGNVIDPLTDSITLQVQWDDLEYHITYNANGGTGDVPEDTTAYHYGDVTQTEDHGALTCDGAKFSHWNTKSDNTGTSYKEGADITVYDNITLYAIWTTDSDPTPIPTVYTVRYDGNGATGGSVPSAKQYNAGSTVTVEDKGDLVREGYTFMEWNTKPNGKGDGYRHNDTFTMPESDVTLYAIWTNGNGDIPEPSPGTGESSFGSIIAVTLMLMSLIATGGVMYVVNFRRKRKSA